jgi:hypothetical protein
MIVNDLHGIGVSISPREANPPLIVDPDAPLPRSISRKLLETVRWRQSQVIERGGGVKHAKFSESNSLDVGWQLPGALQVEDFLRLRISPGAYHARES